jgi:hypothetical protein
VIVSADNSFCFVADAIDATFDDVSRGDRSGECIKGEDVFAVGNIAYHCLPKCRYKHTGHRHSLLLQDQHFQERLRTNTKADQDYL